MSLIELRKVGKILDQVYPQQPLLRQINLKIEPQDFIVIMADNQLSAKALLKIAGLLTPISSGIHIGFNQNIARLSDSKRTILRRNQVSFIFTKPQLLPHYNIMENVQLPLVYTQKQLELSASDEVRMLLYKLGLYQKAHLFPTSLDIGQQQRVAVARALVSKPQLIIADAPTAYLDSANTEIVMNALVEANHQKQTIILNTNNPSLSRYANRIIYLYNNRIRIDHPLEPHQEIDLAKIQAAIKQQNLRIKEAMLAKKRQPGRRDD